MTQITLIKLGLIAICIATVPLSLAQMPRTGTSGSNHTGATTRVTAGHNGLSGNFNSAAQLGTNARSSMSTGANTNAGAHVATGAATTTSVNIIQPQLTQVPIRGPSPNNSPLGPNFSTPVAFPTPSVTPTPTPTPVQAL